MEESSSSNISRNHLSYLIDNETHKDWCRCTSRCHVEGGYSYPPPPHTHTHTPCEQEVSKVGIPIMLYNIPGRCGGGGLTSASIAELYKLPMVSTFFLFFLWWRHHKWRHEPHLCSWGLTSINELYKLPMVWTFINYYQHSLISMKIYFFFLFINYQKSSSIAELYKLSMFSTFI